jgi:hypothetical protein
MIFLSCLMNRIIVLAIFLRRLFCQQRANSLVVTNRVSELIESKKEDTKPSSNLALVRVYLLAFNVTNDIGFMFSDPVNNFNAYKNLFTESSSFGQSPIS